MSIVQRTEVVRALLRALENRNFLVLAGISGTGKTQLARRLGRAITGLDLFEGPGAGIARVRSELDEVDAGGKSWLFGAIPGHDGWVSVKDPPAEIVGTDTRATHTKRVGFLAVRPDWNDARQVWGHYNPLSGAYHASDALVVALNAYRSFLDRGPACYRHFLVLDEMNLAPVEYYLSDLLSLMESPCRVDPGDAQTTILGETARVHPLDQMIISQGRRGVVHDSNAARGSAQDQVVPLFELQERRWIYAPLVDGFEIARRPPGAEIDDADEHDVIPTVFPVPPRIAISPNLTLIGTINVDETTHGFAPKVLDRAFVLEFDEVDYGAALGTHPCFAALKPLLDDLHAALEPAGRHFAYRVAREMLDYVQAAGGTLDREVADWLLMGKVLPKLRGSEPDIGPSVVALLDVATRLGARRSTKRLARMKGELERTGFSSFFQ